MELTIKSEEFNFHGMAAVGNGALLCFQDAETEFVFQASEIHPYSAGHIVGQAVERFGSEGYHMIPAEWVVVEMDVTGDVHYDGVFEEWTVENVKINGQKAEFFGEGNYDAAVDALCTLYIAEVWK